MAKKNGDGGVGPEDVVIKLGDWAPKSRVKLYPGWDDIPFRQPEADDLPFIKRDDPEHLQPKIVVDARIRVFDLSRPKDLSDYSRVWDLAAKGTVMISAEERHWSEKTHSFHVFLRWGELYREMPKEEIYNAEHQRV